MSDVDVLTNVPSEFFKGRLFVPRIMFPAAKLPTMPGGGGTWDPSGIGTSTPFEKYVPAKHLTLLSHMPGLVPSCCHTFHTVLTRSNHICPFWGCGGGLIE